MDLKLIIEHKKKNFQQKGKYTQHAFNEFCDVFKIRDFEDPMVA